MSYLLTPAGDGHYTIMSINSMDSVQVPSSSKTAGALLDQSSPAGGTSQQWSFLGA